MKNRAISLRGRNGGRASRGDALPSPPSPPQRRKTSLEFARKWRGAGARSLGGFMVSCDRNRYTDFSGSLCWRCGRLRRIEPQVPVNRSRRLLAATRRPKRRVEFAPRALRRRRQVRPGARPRPSSERNARESAARRGAIHGRLID